MATRKAKKGAVSENDLPYEMETLESLASGVEAVRAEMVFRVDPAGAEEESELHYQQAVNLLEQARLHLRLAALKQMRAVVARSR